jgi:hypothetical protein
MFDSLAVPFGAKMLFNTIKLKPGVTMDDVELAIGEMCNVVKDTYGGDKGGFCGGQVFKFSGFASPEGSLGGVKSADAHIEIVTYSPTIEQHERTHADKTFNDKFSALATLCSASQELGYEMLWQGAPEPE